MKKSKTYAALKKECDRVFSIYIRKTSASHDGTVSCVSCGVMKPWREVHAGHFVSRTRLATRWDEQNVHPQCPRCNIFLRGNPAGYAKWLSRTYGPEIFDQLVERSYKLTKLSRSDLSELIQTFSTASVGP